MYSVITVIVIIVVLMLQIQMFFSTLKKVRLFKSIFPDSNKLYNFNEESLRKIPYLSDSDLLNHLQQEGEDIEEYMFKIGSDNTFFTEYQEGLNRNKAITFLEGKVEGEISTGHDNSILLTIFSAINDYLKSNKGSVSDFHIMKDIVDRNCDAQEEDFQTQLPIPLYYGLGGTMLGILIGVGFFVHGGGLDLLLTTDNASSSTAVADSSTAIQTLLGGVALAMITSFFGILLTTFGSYLAKNAKSITEKNKHTFLTWIQTSLLPNLSSDTSGALVKMSQNLKAFNETFSENTGELGATLTKVNESYEKQQKLWELIQSIADKDIQQVNIELLSALSESIDEIGRLGNYLKEINTLQANTTDAIEKMQRFFSVGIEQVDTINIGLKNSLERFSENAQLYLNQLHEELDGQIISISKKAASHQEVLQSHFNNIYDTFSTGLHTQNNKLNEHFQKVSNLMETAVDNQLELYKKKANEISFLIDELKNLSALKSSFSGLERAALEQNKKIDDLTKAIERLAEIKTTGAIRTITPRWIKLTSVIGGAAVVLTCLYFLVINVLSLTGVL